ncbi:adenylate kinase [Kallotenue papyrolyticum]|uniref:adenylate kinase n=1 Tax=Kallotenue papyrolyticum TaxID=1325125 RepID=UPI00047863A6|nr:adenylate kinase [Kallotenue papyrolyticum]
MNVVLVGPPGAGKGTQAAALEEKTKLKHIASGELFRQHMRDETELGKLARTYVDRGELVPDDIVITMILERIFQPDCEHGVILDGFPRTKEQAAALERALEEHQQKIDAVIFLNAPRDVLLKRIVGRQTCRNCQTPYNIYYSPPREEGVCDLCGGDLYTRSDDNMETARHRLEVYLQQTAPLIEHYRALGLLHEVDGLGDIHEVTARLVRELGINGELPHQPRT